MVTENINIDVRPGGIPIVIHVTQYEVGLRQFVFTPYTSNGTQTIVAGSATLEGTKPDGYAFQQACEMADGVITYTLQEQLCAVEGRVWSRLVIRDTDGGMIGYTAIVWVVGRAGVADDAVMSDSDISALRQFLDEFGGIDAYRGALNGALAAVGGPLVAATASAMTDTTKVYVYTGSESGYTEGHWYYWNGSAWTDGGVYQSTGINTDKTLTVEGMAADAKATGDAVAELKNDLDENVSDLKSAIDNELHITQAKMRIMESENLLDPANLTVGYITANGSIGDNTSYRITDFIPVTPGETLSFWRSRSDGKTTNGPIISRFCCAFDNNKNVTTGGIDSPISTFVVPSGVSFMRFSFSASYFDFAVMIKSGTETPAFISEYFEPYYVATPEFMPRPYKIGNGYESKAAETSTGINLELLSTNIAKDLLYAFSAEIGNDFTNLIIGSGYPNGSYKSYITIDATNLTFNINGSDYVFPHGLTIADYIKVTIDINDNTKAKVTLTSGGSQFTKTLGWYGFHTDKYAAFSNTGAFSNAVFTVAFKDINANTYVFGDSYVAIVESTSKWSHWLVADGYGKNALLNAYPGEDSANALNALRVILSVGCPKYILWCLGMNDGSDTDAETPNTAWVAGINTVLSLCEENNITPVFATIPTVPTYNHDAKNAWVRSSGYRYVDFAKAVGANSSGVWFSGMLSSDHIHPTELGAKALWNQVLCDFPEITM